jgi:Copine
VSASGPTGFVEILRAVLQHALLRATISCVEVQLTAGKWIYTILFIITDGIIHDLHDTVREVVCDCSLPLSIIIVGVGTDVFSRIEKLNCDDPNTKRGKIRYLNTVNFDEFTKGPAAH